MGKRTMVAAGVTAAAGVAKIIATPIPEFEQGGVFGRAWRATKQAVRSAAHYASVGQRHSGGGIQMMDGATGQHLGEWERGKPYMILSRQTYTNNKHLVDELIDTSLHRGGAPVRPREGGFFESGGTFGAPLPVGQNSDRQQFVQALQRVEAAALETRDAVRALPSRQYIAWEDDNTANVEERLDERQADREWGQVR